MTLVEKVTKALDTGKIVVGVYLDIRKAFDYTRQYLNKYSSGQTI